MRALDVGCGAGFNTEGLARLVGPEGRVVAVDLQPRMLAMTARRLGRSGLSERVELVEAGVEDLGIGSQRPFDFAVAFWMIHEVGNVEHFFEQLRDALASGAAMLMCEPKLHVSRRAFEDSVQAAIRAGFEERDRPAVALSRSALLVKPSREASACSG
jgi:ubiquinone/menaquinone biosynthesis C-methylase UbiE